MTGAFSRRSFLASTALTAAVSCARRDGNGSPPDGSVTPPPNTPPPAGLNPRALITLEAAMERILPADVDVGAKDAGCAAFLDGQLKDPSLVSVARELETMAKVLDVAARKAAKVDFSALGPAEMDELLSQMQARSLHAPKNFDGAHAMRVLVTFTLEGFLSDPRHGGNKAGAGWKFAAFQSHAGHHGHHSLPVVKP